MLDNILMLLIFNGVSRQRALLRRVHQPIPIKELGEQRLPYAPLLISRQSFRLFSQSLVKPAKLVDFLR